MVEIKGIRGSGKTTALLYLAQSSGAIVVEPTYTAANFVKHEAEQLGLTNVMVISMQELLDHSLFLLYKDKKLLIDEIDAFLANLNVEGYTKTVQ